MDPKIHPQPQTNDEWRHRRIMRNLKDAIFEDLAASNPSTPVTHDLNSYVEQRLQEFFPTFDTPTHPPYAWMIRRAIMELNELGGSSEETISRFIEKENKDLPWAHKTLLKHHLKKLCWDEEIMRTKDGKYLLQPEDGDFGQNCGMPKMCLYEDGYDCNDPALPLERTGQTAEQNSSETLPSLRPEAPSKREPEQLKKSLAKAKRNLKSLELKQDHDQAMVAISSSSFTSQILEYGSSLRPLKVLKHDIHQSMRREEKRSEEEWRKQAESACGEVRSIVQLIEKQKQPEERGGKTVCQQEEQEVEVRTKTLESSFDEECGQNSKVPFCKSSFPLPEKGKRSLDQKGHHKGKKNREEKELVIVCGLMAGQSSKSRTYFRQMTAKSCREPISASLELSQQLVQQTKSACRKVRSVLKIIHKEKPEQEGGKTVREQDQQEEEMGAITKIMGSSFDGEYGENLKESLIQNGLQESKCNDEERELTIICYLLAGQQSEVRTSDHKKAPKSCKEPLLASHESSRELGQLNEPHIKLSSPRLKIEAASLVRSTQSQQRRLKVYMRRGKYGALLKMETPLNMSSKMERLERMQQLGFKKSEKPLEFELGTLEEEDAESGQVAAVSLTTTAKTSQNAALDLQKPLKVYSRRSVQNYKCPVKY